MTAYVGTFLSLRIMVKYKREVLRGDVFMPFQIVRDDIVNMKVDAIVNTANPKPVIGYGVDYGIHQKAGTELLDARKKIGNIGIGEAAITPGFALASKYVIHVVSPVWQGGAEQEHDILTKCYENALALASDHGFESVAFPLLSAGNHGFPKDLALQIAVNVVSHFLMQHDMQIYLVVFSSNALQLSKKLFQSVECYINENYIKNKKLEEYGVENKADIRDHELKNFLEATYAFEGMQRMISAQQDKGLADLLKNADAAFSATLLKLIERKGKTDPEVYKRANVDRKLFSKIRNKVNYQPSKSTALAFAIALELDLEETKDFIGRAGYCMSHSSKMDIIVEYFILHGNYDIFEINEALFAFGQPTIGC